MSSPPTDAEVQWLSAEILPQMLASGNLFNLGGNFVAIAEQTFKVLDIQIQFIGVEEAFMLTTCYRAKVSYEYDGVPGTRSLVVKKTPRLPQELYDSINFAALFGNEINTYKTIMPAIEKFANRTFNIPKFCFGASRSDFATLVLEDFSGAGWRMTKDKANLSLEHVLIAVKYLADFHGTCLALRQQQRAHFDELMSLLKEARYATSVLHPDYDVQLKASVERLLQATQQYEPNVPVEFLQRFCHMTAKPFAFGKTRVRPVEPLVTLCHGDFLRNNVAYKYGLEKQNADTPQDMMMFDLQTMRLGSPMIDLTILLNLSAFASVRHTHFPKIFGTYCEALAANYQNYVKGELPAYLSEQSLLEEYIYLLPYAIGIAAAFLPILVNPRNISSEEMLNEVRTPEEIRFDALTRGGAVVDAEIAAQMREMYELDLQHKVDIFTDKEAQQ